MSLDNCFHKPLRTLRAFLGTGFTKPCTYYLYISNLKGTPLDMGPCSKRFKQDHCRVRYARVMNGNQVYVTVG